MSSPWPLAYPVPPYQHFGTGRFPGYGPSWSCLPPRQDPIPMLPYWRSRVKAQHSVDCHRIDRGLQCITVRLELQRTDTVRGFCWTKPCQSRPVSQMRRPEATMPALVQSANVSRWVLSTESHLRLNKVMNRSRLVSASRFMLSQ